MRSVPGPRHWCPACPRPWTDRHWSSVAPALGIAGQDKDRRRAPSLDLGTKLPPAGRPGPEMFRRLGQELDVRLYLLDPETGVSLFGDGQRSSFAGPLTASYTAHGGAIPGVLRLTREGAPSGELGAVAVAVPGEPPTILVAEPMGSQLPSPVLLHHIATGRALELAQLATARERQRKLGAGLLADVLDRRVIHGWPNPSWRTSSWIWPAVCWRWPGWARTPPSPSFIAGWPARVCAISCSCARGCCTWCSRRAPSKLTCSPS